MHRFERQNLIPGWNQLRLESTPAVVVGRGWPGVLTVWGLMSMGVSHIAWMGRPQSHTERMAAWLLSQPLAGSAVDEFPFDIQYGPELTLAGKAQAVLICTSPDPRQRALCASVAADAGHAVVGPPAVTGEAAESPALALLVAALELDAFRHHVTPIEQDFHTAELAADLFLSTVPAEQHLLIVGIGGIGVYAATAFAASGVRITLVDDDIVESSNLNRQGLFTAEDVGSAKAAVAARRLRAFFPGARVDVMVRRVGDDFVDEARALHVDGILSAVDNARTRLCLQRLGGHLGVPVVQGGTSVFMADCFTQVPGGPTLDEQMAGVLSRAAERESAGRRAGGGCAAEASYVVPGMVAAAFMCRSWPLADRASTTPASLHWRSGLPLEEGTPP